MHLNLHVQLFLYERDSNCWMSIWSNESQVYSRTFSLFSSFRSRFFFQNEKSFLIRQCDLKLKFFSELFNDLCDGIELINSTFSFHIVFVITSFLLTNVFAAYTTLREVLSQSSQLGHLAVGASLFVLIHYLIKLFIAYVGSSTTTEAEKPLKVVSKALGSLNFEENLKVDLNFFLIQMQSRNKNLQNNFFVINWNFILAVIMINFQYAKFYLKWFSVSGHFHSGHLSHYNLSVWCLFKWTN